MRNPSVSAVIFLTALFAVCGCAEKNEEILARVGEVNITLDDFNRQVENLPKHYKNIVSEQKREFLQDLIMQELFYNAALANGIENFPEVKELIKEANKKIIISRYLKENVDDKIEITETELKRYYDEHSEDFMMPERWRAVHILVDTEEESRQIKAMLEEGASFEELAKSRSIDASAKDGGDVGYFSKGQLIPEFEDACLSLEVGEMSDVVKTKLGYHIIRLMESKPPEVQEFATVKRLIKKEMEQERKKEFLREITKRLRADTEIVLNEELLEKLDTDKSGDFRESPEQTDEGI